MKRLLILTLLVMIIAGCDGFGGGGSGGMDVFDPYQGSAGLQIDLLPNSPPDRVKSGGHFRSGVMIENVGAYDVSGAKIVMTHNRDDLSVGNIMQTINLLGKSRFMKVGETDTFFWEADVTDTSEDITSQVGYIITYKYQTNAFVDYCIDPDRFEQQVGDKSCDSPDSLSLSGQGAPVGVSQITSTYFPLTDTTGEIELEITVSNLKDGEIYGGSSVSSLGPINTASLQASISGNSINCDPDLVFEEGSAETKCYTTYNKDVEEIKPLHIIVDYVYQQEIPDAEFTIEKPQNN